MSKLNHKGHAASFGKCTTCKHKYIDASKWLCIQCRDNPLSESFYEEEVKPLKNLFKGAPVIADNTKRYYYKYKSCFYNGATDWTASAGDANTAWSSIRLPTIEESPRNVWLAAPADGKCPEGAEGLNIIVWFEGHDVPFPEYKTVKELDWYVITKFMIIDKEAFE